jgi:hypothetical protein
MRIVLVALAACGAAQPARHGVSIDRFSKRAAHLLVGKGVADQPIDLDRPPFVTQGLAPDGSVVRYYNFDVQSPIPAVLHKDNSIDVVPGDAGYSDFFVLEGTRDVIDCPVVPRGTRPKEGDPVVRELTYRGTQVECLQFGAPLTLGADGKVPTSPIYVTFGREDGVFVREGETPQTHNVLFSLPGDSEYSPLWAVHVYDARAFSLVHDEATALRARIVKEGPLVNCPVVRWRHE